jgi:putative membrane protein
MILIGATAITQRYIKKRILHVPVIVILLLITDLVLDPGAVALNYWSYSLDNLPHFYGVPLSNFLGWILSGSIGSLLFLIFAQQKISSKATVSLLLIAVFWTGVDIYKGLYIPAFVGVVLTVICFITVWGSESVKE